MNETFFFYCSSLFFTAVCRISLHVPCVFFQCGVARIAAVLSGVIPHRAFFIGYFLRCSTQTGRLGTVRHCACLLVPFWEFPRDCGIRPSMSYHLAASFSMILDLFSFWTVLKESIIDWHYVCTVCSAECQAMAGSSKILRRIAMLISFLYDFLFSI